MADHAVVSGELAAFALSVLYFKIEKRGKTYANVRCDYEKEKWQRIDL